MMIKSWLFSKAVIGVTIFTLILTPIWWLIGNWYRDNLLESLRSDAALDLSYRADELSAAINRRLSLVDGLYAFVITSLSDNDFERRLHDFSAGLFSSIPGIRNISVAPEGTVTFVYPLVGNETLLGYQPIFDSRSIVRDDVLRAIEKPQIVISGPIVLITGGYGMIFTRSVFTDGFYWGLVRVEVDFSPIIERAGLEGDTQGLTFSLRDKTGKTIYGSNETFYKDPVIRRIAFHDEVWELAGVPKGGWSERIRNELVVFRTLILLIVGLFSGLIYLFVNRQERFRESEKRRQVAEGLREVIAVLNSRKSLDEVLDYLLSQAAKIMNASASALHRIYRAEGLLELTNYYELDKRLRVYKNLSVEVISNERDLLDGESFSVREYARENEVYPLEEVDPATATWWQAVSELYQTTLSVPVTMGGEVFGCITLYYSRPANFSNEEIGLASAFADQAALAIENNTFHEQSKILASFQERQKISRDLHDSLSQVLYGIWLGTRTAKEIIVQSKEDSELKASITESVDYVNQLAQTGLNEMRELILDLHPDELGREGLIKLLEKRVEELKIRHPLEWYMNFGPEPNLPIQSKAIMLRIAQEAMNNILKHSQATEVLIKLNEDHGYIKMEITDNGIGFDPEGKFPGHIGLNVMRDRANQLKAEFSIDSKLGEGTRISLLIPPKNELSEGISSPNSGI